MKYLYNIVCFVAQRVYYDVEKDVMLAALQLPVELHPSTVSIYRCISTRVGLILVRCLTEYAVFITTMCNNNLCHILVALAIATKGF